MAKTPSALLLLGLLATTAATADSPAEVSPNAPASAESDIPVGDFADDLPTRLDSTKHYTLYVPPSYRPGQRLPVLLILDPRGRARKAATIFRPAADRYGWILVSSNDIRGNTSFEPNQKALAAVWPEIHRYPIDPRRIYIAGFSGGAILAWILGQNTGALAGMISSGGRLQEGISEKAPCPHWGAAGGWDFNYGEMRHIDDLLAEQGVPHWLEIFPGAHSWMPEELATQAAGWMELQAMRSGRRERDPALIDQLWEDWVAEAESREAAGEQLSALRRLRQLEETFRGLREVAELRAPIERLEASREVARQVRQERKGDAEVDRYVREKVSLLSLARSGTESTHLRLFEPADRFKQEKLTEGRAHEAQSAEARATRRGTADVEELKRRLELNRLLDESKGSDYSAVAARRKLQFVATQASFYLARDWMAQGDWKPAQTVLQIAIEAGARTPRVWFDLARCASRLHQAERAIEALRKAMEAGWSDAEPLRSGEDFVPLRERDDFKAIVAELERASMS